MGQTKIKSDGMEENRNIRGFLCNMAWPFVLFFNSHTVCFSGEKIGF